MHWRGTSATSEAGSIRDAGSPASRSYRTQTPTCSMSRLRRRRGSQADRIKGLTRRRLTKWRHGPGVFKVDYALRAPPPWRDETLAAAGTVHIGGTASDVESSERASVEGSHTSRPFVLLAQPTVADQSRSPVGTHVVWAYCHVPNGSTHGHDRSD